MIKSVTLLMACPRSTAIVSCGNPCLAAAVQGSKWIFSSVSRRNLNSLYSLSPQNLVLSPNSRNCEWENRQSNQGLVMPLAPRITTGVNFCGNLNSFLIDF